MSAPAPKPFTLQSPEHIAMEYGGNKQKIAQAVQSGLVDPTAGLMAGMFIDRMRAAQAQEQAPQQTVAQKVLGPRPSQMPPQGGLGGLPPGGPQGAPPMQMASAAPPPGGPPPQGPVGMAEGGLTTLPVPDYMFDEHTFAGGGIVAFDAGGDARAERIKTLMAIGRMGGPKGIAAMEELNQLTGTTRRASEGFTLGGKSLADIDVASMAANEASGQVPFFHGLSEQPNPDIYNYVAPQDLKLPTLALASETARPRTTGIPFMSARNPAAAPAAAPAAVVPPPRPAVLRPRAPAGPAKTTTPDDDYGLPKAPEAFNQKKTFDDILAMMGPAPKATTASAEEKAKERNYDTGMAMLAAASAGLARGSKTFLGALGDAGEGAMPVLAESAKARRADAKEERQAQFEQEKTEYGARGTAAAATRAEQNTMREYDLNLAQARAKIANERGTLALDTRKANDLAKYYGVMGAAAFQDKDMNMVNKQINALVAGGMDPNTATITAIREQQGKGLAGTHLTPNQALLQAQKETTALDFKLPPGMTTQQFINARRNELMGSAANPVGGDIDLGTMTTP